MKRRINTIWKKHLENSFNDENECSECNDDLENVENGRKFDHDKSGIRTWVVGNGKRIRCA